MATRVLFVDDSEDLLELNKDILSTVPGYDVQTASSGARALEIVGTWHPDLVVTDIIMPEMSGLELITRIRTELAPPMPIIIALSGFRELETDAIYRGAAAFHLKPTDTAELLAIVRSALAGAVPAPALREQANDRRTRGVDDGARAAEDHARTMHPEGVDRVRLTCRIMSGYFDHVVCVVMMMKNNSGLTVLASSSPDRITEGASSQDLLRIAPEVIESGSTLVVPDLERLPGLLAASPETAFRFVVSAPIRMPNGVLGGSLTLLDERPREFSGSDLAIVEHLARWGSEVLAGVRWRVVFSDYGLLQPRNWMTWFSEEFEQARTLGRSIGVAMFAPAAAIEHWQAATLWQRLPPHTALTAMADGVIGAYTMAKDPTMAETALDQVLEAVTEAWGVSHGAIITHDRYALPTEPRAAVELAQGVLETARRQGLGTVVLRASVSSYQQAFHTSPSAAP